MVAGATGAAAAGVMRLVAGAAAAGVMRLGCGAAMAVCNLRIAIRASRIAIRRPLCGCGVTEGWRGIGAWHGVVGKTWWINSGPMVRCVWGGIGQTNCRVCRCYQCDAKHAS